jgi:hypothetical protein
MTHQIRTYNRRYAKARHGGLLVRSAAFGSELNGAKVEFSLPARLVIAPVNGCSVEWPGTFVNISSGTLSLVELAVSVFAGRFSVKQAGGDTNVLHSGAVGSVVRHDGFMFAVTPDMADGEYLLRVQRGESRLEYDESDVAALSRRLEDEGVRIRVRVLEGPLEPFCAVLQGGETTPSTPLTPLPMYHLNYIEGDDCEDVECNCIMRWNGVEYQAQ